MHISLETLKKQLVKYEIQCGGCNIPSALEALWELYFESNPADDGQIRQAEADLSQLYPELSLPASDALTNTIYSICIAYQRAAFLEGIQIGFHLAEELNAPIPADQS